MQSALAPSLSADALRQKEIDEWDARIGDFVGKRVEQGDVWEGEGEFASPAGPVKFASLTRFSKVESRGGRPIVTIDLAYAVDGVLVQKAMELVQNGVADLGKHMPVEAHVSSVSTVDPGCPASIAPARPRSRVGG
jgi:hypothetical protein